MSERQSPLARLREARIRPGLLPVLVVMLAIFCLGAMVQWQTQIAYQQGSRADVLKELSVIRAKLEGNLYSNLQLVRGLIATIKTEPDMTQARFEALASELFDEDSQLRSVAAAPGLVVSLMYPLAGNEKALGLDYNKNAAQRDSTVRARDTGQLVLAGPVSLVQGGKAFIGRFPVFIDEGEKQRFWGVVSAVIDADRLYQDSGLFDDNLGIQIAITGVDGKGIDGGQFFGSPSILDQQPVTADVALPSGDWIISAMPKDGWRQLAPMTIMIWAAVIVLGLLVAAPTYYAVQLSTERQKHVMALRSRESELQKLSRRLGLALETSQVGVFEYDLDTGELLWDDRVNALFGLPQDKGRRTYADWRNALHEEDRERAEEEFRIATQITGRYRSDYRIVTQDGTGRNVRAIGAVYRDAAGTTKIVGVNWDVSVDVALNENLKRANRLSEARNAELEAAKASIEHNSLHDSLTGLPNRRYLDDVLMKRATEIEHSGGALSLLHIDLDRFKQINDTLGHGAGDAMLVHVAEVLKRNIRVEDFAARIGGDEFVVVSEEADSGVLSAIADRIIQQMRVPLQYYTHAIRSGVSVGIATESGSDANAKRLMINADIALYRAKSRGRNRYEFFTDALQAEVIRSKGLADEIQLGLERNEFFAYYQPQFDAHTYEIVGVEALARWRHPCGRILAPSEFLDVAEEQNAVPAIDRIVFEHALQQMKSWKAQGFDVGKVAVNVSARRLQDEHLVDSLRHAAFEPGQLSFELVESVFLDDTDEVVRWNIDQIRELGIDIEIDDFGTGYASIVSLMKLRPRRMKIDRQLVLPIVESVQQRQLVKSIVDIGLSLGTEIIGEGVETMEHAEILRDLGCSSLQGYLFAQPMSAEALGVFMSGRAWMPQSAVPRKRAL